MEAFGTINGRRAALRLNRRDGSIVIIDEASGEVLVRHQVGTANELRLDGHLVRWGANTMVLDPGEDQVATTVLQSSPSNPYDDQRIFEEEVQLEVLRQGAMTSARRATAAANVVTVVLVILGALMAIGGIVMMLQRERGYAGWERPYLSSGVTLLGIGAAEVSFGLMLSFGVSAVVQYVHYRAELDALDND